MKKDGGMWMVGEWLSALATCMRVVLILVLCAETPDSGLPGASDTTSYTHIAEEERGDVDRGRMSKWHGHINEGYPHLVALHVCR